MVGEANAKSVAYLETVEASAAQILVHLSKSAIPNDADSILLSSITEATFDGYEPFELHFEACEVPDDEWAEIASEEVLFEAGDIVDPEIIYYAYCTHTPPGGIAKIVGFYEFPEPVLLDTQGQQISTGAWRFRQIPETF